MILDRNNQLHDRVGRYTFKEVAPSSVSLGSQAVHDLEPVKELLRDALIFYGRHGRPPLKGFEEERTLHAGLEEIGKAWMAGQLPDELVEDIQDLPFDIEDCTRNAGKADLLFASYALRAHAFLDEHGRIPTHRKETAEEGPLYNWMTRLRAEDRAGNLTEQQRAQLDALPMNILATKPDQEYEEKFKQFQAYMDEAGRPPQPLDTGHAGEMYKFMRGVNYRMSKPNPSASTRRILKQLSPDAANALLGKAGIPTRKDAVLEKNLDIVLAWLDENQRHPSAYNSPEENKILKLFLYIRDSNRDTPEKVSRLSQHAVYRNLPDGIYEDQRVFNGQQQRAQMVAGWRAALEKHGPGASEHLRKNEPKLYKQAQAVISKRRQGVDIHTYPEVEEAIEQLFGPNWHRPAREVSEKRKATMRKEAKRKNDELRAFMASSGGRRPSRRKKDEIHLMGWIRSRQLAYRSANGLDPETMEELNDILGVGWEAVRSPAPRPVD